MITTYIKIGFRSLVKHRFFSFINLAGMTVGLTCFILIALYIQYELSYDGQHEKADRIYRVSMIQKGNEFKGTDRFALAPKPLATTLKNQFPEVEEATTLTLDETLIRIGTKTFYAQGLFSDRALFKVFDYNVIEGIGEKALEDPKSVILTESMAKKHFGNTPAIGKTIQLENDGLLTVKGIVSDVPNNQHFSFDYITSYKNYRYYQNSDSWASNNYYAYIVLPKGYDYTLFNKKMDALEVYTIPAYKQFPFRAEYYLQPLKDIRLRSQINFEIGPTSDIRYIYLSATIALIIVLLAGVNYMNLASARASSRSKEVGVRKVLGAKKKHLINQFISESLLVTLFSFVLASLLSLLLLPIFNNIIGSAISQSFSGKTGLFLLLFIVALGIGIISGLYPAFLASAIAPIKALKGVKFKSKDGAFLRNALVVGQFAAAIVLAIASVVVYQQLDFIQNKKLGYSKGQIVYIPYQKVDFYDKNAVIKDELLKHPQIQRVALTNNMPLTTEDQTIIEDWEGNSGNEKLFAYRNYIDDDYVSLFEMKLVAGRNFSEEFPTDQTESILINESAVKALGWSNAIGKLFNGKKVIGVIQDFHFQPFQLSIEPMFIGYRTKSRSFYSSNIAIKVTMDDLDNTLAHIERTMKTHIPNIPFEYQFMDESYAQLYKSEKRFGKIFNVFTLIALFIACMGLFGLIAHKVAQRSKEIGVRKVLGASDFHIVGLFSKSFLKLVALATLISIPIGWFAMERWLQDFAYRIDINWMVFFLTGFLAMTLALFTVGIQTLSAANKNPVDTLREE